MLTRAVLMTSLSEKAIASDEYVQAYLQKRNSVLCVCTISSRTDDKGTPTLRAVLYFDDASSSVQLQWIAEEQEPAKTFAEMAAADAAAAAATGGT